jgi:metallo-beta-lactamase family protein
MQIQFCGAAREVTGSCHLITLDNGFTILMDCGLYQGFSDEMKDFNTSWAFVPADINVVLVSHAHIDHTGRLPKLVKDGFKNSIFSTPATRDLSAIMLMDSAGIQEKDAEYYNRKRSKGPEDIREALYTEDDAAAAMALFVSMPYEKWFEVGPGVEVMFRDAGHILGSANINLRITEDNKVTRVAFSGDIGRPFRPILGDPLPMESADVVICESTYGDRLHESAPDELEHFARLVNEAVERKGKIIVPAFSVGRTQELVYMLDRLVTLGKIPKIPVYVDSPLSVNATNVFVSHPECFDSDLRQYMTKDPNPFGFNTLKYVRTLEESKQLNLMQGPMMIIASSGMANAGRVKHHLFNSIDNARNTVLIVGYASANTPAGQLRAGAPKLKLFGAEKPVLAHIEVLDSFSAHGDQAEMTAFMANQAATAKHIFLVHGEEECMGRWRTHLQANGFNNAVIEIPELKQKFSI